MITLKELNDREEMDFSRFIRNLKTHEWRLRFVERERTYQEEIIAFKATPSSIEEEESSEDGDEDFTILI